MIGKKISAFSDIDNSAQKIHRWYAQYKHNFTNLELSNFDIYGG